MRWRKPSSPSARDRTARSPWTTSASSWAPRRRTSRSSCATGSRLIADLPPDDPARALGAQEIARLERLAFTGEVRGEGYQDGQRPLPSLNDHEQPRRVPGVTF